MSEEQIPTTSQNELIPLDPQLLGNFHSVTRPEPIALDPNLPDLIPLDARLSSEVQKALKPDLVALDPRLTTSMVEGDHSNKVPPGFTPEYKSTNQLDNTQEQSTEQK